MDKKGKKMPNFDGPQGGPPRGDRPPFGGPQGGPRRGRAPEEADMPEHEEEGEFADPTSGENAQKEKI